MGAFNSGGGNCDKVMALLRFLWVWNVGVIRVTMTQQKLGTVNLTFPNYNSPVIMNFRHKDPVQLHPISLLTS